jgi:hypothetical protein
LYYSIGVAQLLNHGAGEEFVDFAVTWNRLAHFCARILLPVVLAAVPDQDASHARELLDERGSLHET